MICNYQNLFKSTLWPLQSQKSIQTSSIGWVLTIFTSSALRPGFAFLKIHLSQPLTFFSTSDSRPGQKKRDRTRDVVRSRPWWLSHHEEVSEQHFWNVLVEPAVWSADHQSWWFGTGCYFYKKAFSTLSNTWKHLYPHSANRCFEDYSHFLTNR